MSIVTVILMLVMSFIIGTVAEKITPLDMPGDWAGAIVAGLIGAWIGPKIFGTWGPSILNFSIIPALIGAMLVVIIVSIINKILD